jgi:hypothetical protein
MPVYTLPLQATSKFRSHGTLEIDAFGTSIRQFSFRKPTWSMMKPLFLRPRFAASLKLPIFGAPVVAAIHSANVARRSNIKEFHRCM